MFKKVKEKVKNNKVLMISLITLLIILIGGVSYAAYDYSFVGKDSSLSTGSVSIKFLESNTNVIDIKNALPTSDNDGKKDSNTFDFSVTSKASYDTSLKYTLSIEKLSVDTGYTSLSDNQMKVYLTDYNNKELVSPTLISNLSDKLLYSKTNKHSSTNTSVTDKYKLRVWVDYNVDSSNWTKDTKYEYKFKMGIKSSEVGSSLDKSGANEPVIDSNMIPVYYDETSETWKKADESNSNKNYQWYDYDNKMWANSVTVSSTNRSTYQKASLGTEIPMDDILTMQVWIPRYKYKVWNYNSDGTKSSNEQEIEITFENGTDKTGEISCQDAISGTDGDPSETCKLKATNSTCTDATCNSKTYTHPAFTFGNEEIKGFWVGKFEFTGAIDSITTKPDLECLRSQNISTYETNIMNMKNSGNSYGFSTNTDTHMIKNMEWGAVVYLSHSKYGTCSSGVCKAVSQNNSFDGYTGRSGGGLSVSGTDAGTYKYNQIKNSDGTLIGSGQDGPSASTTHNVYGVYDMAGGALEYVMANVISNDGITMLSGSDSSGNSGYTGKVYDLDNYTSYTGIAYPDSKYYDKYSFSASDESRIRSKLGDAIKEVYKSSSYVWYDGYSFVPSHYLPWFARGGGFYPQSSSADLFIYNGRSGIADFYHSSRIVITP